MGRLCARPGCSAPAAATFNFDGLNRIVWLHELTAAAAHGAGDLCGHHADRLRAPRNWELRDSRPGLPTDHRVPAAPSRQRPPTGPPTEREPARVATSDAESEPVVPAARVDTGESSRPRVGGAATTPLLARAFRGVDRG